MRRLIFFLNLFRNFANQCCISNVYFIKILAFVVISLIYHCRVSSRKQMNRFSLINCSSFTVTIFEHRFRKKWMSLKYVFLSLCFIAKAIVVIFSLKCESKNSIFEEFHFETLACSYDDDRDDERSSMLIDDSECDAELCACAFMNVNSVCCISSTMRTFISAESDCDCDAFKYDSWFDSAFWVWLKSMSAFWLYISSDLRCLFLFLLISNSRIFFEFAIISFSDVIL